MSYNRFTMDEPLRFYTRDELEKFTVDQLRNMIERSGVAVDDLVTKEDHIDKYLMGQMIMMENNKIANRIKIMLNTK